MKTRCGCMILHWAFFFYRRLFSLPLWDKKLLLFAINLFLGFVFLLDKIRFVNLYYVNLILALAMIMCPQKRCQLTCHGLPSRNSAKHCIIMFKEGFGSVQVIVPWGSWPVLWHFDSPQFHLAGQESYPKSGLSERNESGDPHFIVFLVWTKALTLN